MHHQNHTKLLINTCSFFNFYILTINDQIYKIITEDRLKSDHIATSNIYKAQIIQFHGQLQYYLLKLNNHNKAILYVTPQQRKYQINDHIIVQVTKEATPNKLAIVTDKINLLGYYAILCPFSDKLIFNKALNQEQKDVLHNAYTQYIHPAGMIIRSIVKHDNLQATIKQMQAHQHQLQQIQQSTHTTQLLVAYSVLEKILLNHQIDEIIINDLLSTNTDIMEESKKLKYQYQLTKLNISHYINANPNMLEEEHQLDQQLNSILQPNININNNINITVYHHDAFNYIDVDYQGDSHNYNVNYKNQNYQINNSILNILVQNIIARNLSGQILIDLLKMKNPQHKKDITTKMQQLFNKDHVKTNVLGVSNLGILEITRQHHNASLQQQITNNLAYNLYQLLTTICQNVHLKYTLTCNTETHQQLEQLIEFNYLHKNSIVSYLIDDNITLPMLHTNNHC